jgi:manganese transport protein
MAARLGTVAQIGLGEAITGAVLGLEAAFPDIGSRQVWAGVITLIAGGILMFGGYRAIERLLIGAVILMSIAFATALVVIGPDMGALVKGISIPTIPIGALPIIIGLIGTTIVPYNLFLHAAAAHKRWAGPEDLGDARFDATLSIGFGGVISILVLATAAGSLFSLGLEVNNAADMARQLEPAFGPQATYLLAAGLFAAGLSSAITAPLATGYATAELFGFDSNPRPSSFALSRSEFWRSAVSPRSPICSR